MSYLKVILFLVFLEACCLCTKVFSSVSLISRYTFLKPIYPQVWKVGAGSSRHIIHVQTQPMPSPLLEETAEPGVPEEVETQPEAPEEPAPAPNAAATQEQQQEQQEQQQEQPESADAVSDVAAAAAAAAAAAQDAAAEAAAAAAEAAAAMDVAAVRAEGAAAAVEAVSAQGARKPFRNSHPAHCEFPAIAAGMPGGAARTGSANKELFAAKMMACVYESKPEYPVFAGWFVMNQQSVPQLGEPLEVPWIRVKGTRPLQHRNLGRVSTKLLQLLPPQDLLRPGMFDSCAVVGNAGILLSQNLGPEIDLHDAVIRFNGGRTLGFEPHVGSKTTIRLTNRQHLFFRESDAELVLQHATIMSVFNDYMRYKTRNPRVRTHLADMSFYEQMIDWKHVVYPTNGFLGLKMAVSLCRTVNLYGFIRTWSGWFDYHYFDGEEPNASQAARDRQGEFPVLLQLLRQHCDRVAFRHPCIADQACIGCPQGVAMCDGTTPFAMPTPPHCRVNGTECFIACPPEQVPCAQTAGVCPEGLYSGDPESCAPPPPPEARPTVCDVLNTAAAAE